MPTISHIDPNFPPNPRAFDPMDRLEELLESGSAIAVVGMAAHVPGASGVREFWRNLRDGVESIRTISDEQLRAAGIPDELLNDPAYVKAAAPLDGMADFDAGFFGMNPRDAAVMDPQHRHFLECAWEALEDAGHLPERFDGPIGVFAGSGANAYFWANVMTNPDLVRDVGYFLLRHTGNDKDFLSTRVSYELNLKGPSVNVQTACSTSLVAVHLAVESLLTRECDMVLAGGVTIEFPHGIGYLYRENEILSPDGHCRSFDAESGGTVFGSGAGVVVLRRLEDAIADGDDIRAVVLGTAVNNDGSGKVGYLAPSVDGQARAIAEALTVARVSSDEVGYVEAHGTGTAVGDPIEVMALTQAFRTGTDRTGYCGLGSVKTNIGHLDTAAGVAGLIKVISALRHEALPPSLHFESPNPRIDYDDSPFRVVDALRDWPRGGSPRRAGVSSLGVGGTNAFVVVEEAPSPPVIEDDGRAFQLLPVSGRSRRVLEAASADLSGYLEEEAESRVPLADVAFTLSMGRRGFEERRVVVAGSVEEAVDALVSGDETRVFTGRVMERAPTVSFMFAGGGAQYPGMGSDLHAREPVYREVVERCLAHMDDRLSAPVRAFLLDPESLDTDLDLERPTLALPALFITQLAQSRLWMSWGVEPESMIGHSMGEYTAACLSGVLSTEDAIDLVVVRARLFEEVPDGGMLSVNLPESALREILPDGLSIAAVNGPELTVASGPPEALRTLEAHLSAAGVEFRRVHISVAAHSAMLDGILDRFREAVSRFDLSAPGIPFASNLSGDWITEGEARDPDYWVRQLRHEVRFSDGVKRLLDGDPGLLLEVGPGRTLATLARMNQEEEDSAEAFTSMRTADADDSDLAFQLAVLGRLWTRGAEIDWTKLYAGQTRRRVSLPTYPFERERHWIAPGRGVPLQDGMGLRSEGDLAPDRDDPLADWFYAPTWTEEPLPAAADGVPSAGSVLVFGAEARPDLVRRLEAAGLDPVPVSLGDSFVDTDEGGFRLRPGQPEDVVRVFDRLTAEGRTPGTALFAHLLETNVVPVHGSTMPDNATDLAFHRLFDFVKALGEVDPEGPFQIILAGRGMVHADPDDRVEPWKSMAFGPMRVTPRELPSVRTRVLDMGQEADDAAVGDAVAAELGASGPETVVAYRGGRRLVEGFEALDVSSATPSDDAVRLRGVPTWLITGGLGGLGLTFALHLAAKDGANLVLLGRSGLPDRNRWEDWITAHGSTNRTSRRIRSIRELEALGATVEVVAADVGDFEAVRRAVEATVERFGSVDGVIHAAGVLDDAPILVKTRDQAAAVLHPKVAGIAALERALADQDPGIFIAFSSRSATVGLPGQVDYTSANAVLDAWAQRARSEGRAGVFSVEWDVWREVGMAAELHAQLTGEGPGAPAPEPIEHPIFETRKEDAAGEVVYAVTFRAGTHWMLDEHRLRGGSALIPGTGFLELVRAAFELDGVEPPFAMRDVMFLAPFLVEDGESRELAVRIRRNDVGGEFTIVGRPDPDAEWTDHATGRFESLEPVDLPTVSPASLSARCRKERVEVGGRPENPFLDFGPRWASLVRLDRGENEALLRIELPDEFADDLDRHGLHPALLDIATASAQSLVPEFGEEGRFYIPASYADLTVRASLSPFLLSHVRLRDRIDGMAIFDVSIMDADGRELISVEEFVMVRVDEGAQLGSAPGATPRREIRFEGARSEGVEGIDEGIGPEDGVRVLDRILQNPGGFPPVVAVMRRDLFAVLESLEGGARDTAARHEPPPVDVSPLVDALMDLPAIVDAAAVAHRYSTDDVRIVAFVVYDPAKPSTVSSLRRRLRETLPADLVPRNFVEMTGIPRDDSGRVEREALPDPFAPRDEHVAPRTPTQETIAEIWKRLMGLSRVSIHDNFLDAGGHSLLGIRALLQIEKRTGVRLHPNQLTMQTLEQLAAEVDRRNDERESPDSEAADGSPSLPSRIQSAFRQIVGGGQRS